MIVLFWSSGEEFDHVCAILGRHPNFGLSNNNPYKKTSNQRKNHQMNPKPTQPNHKQTQHCALYNQAVPCSTPTVFQTRYSALAQIERVLCAGAE